MAVRHEVHTMNGPAWMRGLTVACHHGRPLLVMELRLCRPVPGGVKGRSYMPQSEREVAGGEQAEQPLVRKWT